MDQETMLHHLEELAERLGITLRYESAAGRVGLCKLRGKRVAVIDANLRVSDRLAALASILTDEDLNGVYVPPAVRRRLEGSSPLRVRPGEAGLTDDAAPADSETGEVHESDAGGEAGAD